MDCNLCDFYNVVVFVFCMYIRNSASGCDVYTNKVSIHPSIHRSLALGTWKKCVNICPRPTSTVRGAPSLISKIILSSQSKWSLMYVVHGCLPFNRKIQLGCRKHNGKWFTSLPQNCHIRYGLNPKKGRICVAWVWNRVGIEKFVNGKQHSIWFVPTGMNGLPQNVLLNFRLEFPKSDLTIYLPSGISEILCQMVSTP